MKVNNTGETTTHTEKRAGGKKRGRVQKARGKSTNKWEK